MACQSGFSQGQQEHNARLRTVLNKLQKASVTLNMGKRKLSKQEVRFFCRILCAEGVQPDLNKVRAVKTMREASNVNDVHTFLGMVNQLGKYIPGLAEKDKPLRDLLSKKNQWVWSSAQQNSFDQRKSDLTSAPVLTLYDPNKELAKTVSWCLVLWTWNGPIPKRGSAVETCSMGVTLLNRDRAEGCMGGGVTWFNVGMQKI